VIYGVKVANQPGRAGMAAIVVGGNFSFESLAAYVEQLPVYARPLFVRVCKELDLTATFKLSRNRFMQEGYRVTSDPIWAYDPASSKFSVLQFGGK
jgi:fatty-acyl-CoA synthase